MGSQFDAVLQVSTQNGPARFETTGATPGEARGVLGGAICCKAVLSSGPAAPLSALARYAAAVRASELSTAFVRFVSRRLNSAGRFAGAQTPTSLEPPP